jgi:hypothetical protein
VSGQQDQFFYQSLTYQPKSTIETPADISAIRTGGVEQLRETFGRGRVPGRRPWHSALQTSVRWAQVSDLAANISALGAGLRPRCKHPRAGRRSPDLAANIDRQVSDLPTD